MAPLDSAQRIALAAAARPRLGSRAASPQWAHALLGRELSRSCFPAMYVGVPGLVVLCVGGPGLSAVPVHPRFQLMRLLAPGPDQKKYRFHLTGPFSYVLHLLQKQGGELCARLVLPHAWFQQAPRVPSAVMATISAGAPLTQLWQTWSAPLPV